MKLSEIRTGMSISYHGIDGYVTKQRRRIILPGITAYWIENKMIKFEHDYITEVEICLVSGWKIFVNLEDLYLKTGNFY